ncbi:MAG: thiamine-phosphate kinase [Pseudomonadota bacterium]
MKPGEFDLIARLARAAAKGSGTGVAIGIGDDAAVLEPRPGCELVSCIDTLVSDVHYPASTPAPAVGHKALAVNLSDLAAMGAVPRWALLSLALPAPSADWLDGFAEGFFKLAGRHGVSLTGGDTVATTGPAVISVQVLGEVPAGEALTRAQAQPGDQVAVTGTLGGAALALKKVLAGEVPEPGLRQLLDRPEPRVAAGLELRGLASAAIDLSDGLASDLKRLADASGVAIEVDVPRLPLHPELAGQSNLLPLALSGGDDYELCFCLPSRHEDKTKAALAALGLPMTIIGSVAAGSGLAWRTAEGAPLEVADGYEHFGS